MYDVAVLSLLFLMVVFTALFIRASSKEPMARKPKNRFAGWRRYGFRKWELQVMAPKASDAWDYLIAHPPKDTEVDGAEVVLPSDEHPLDKPGKKGSAK